MSDPQRVQVREALNHIEDDARKEEEEGKGVRTFSNVLFLVGSCVVVMRCSTLVPHSFFREIMSMAVKIRRVKGEGEEVKVKGVKGRESQPEDFFMRERG